MIDRAAISDVVNTYATAVDKRDWTLFKSLFTDRVYIDMSDLDPARCREISSDELVDLARPLTKLSSTQHASSNHRHDINGDTATCISYMQARHFLTRDGTDYHYHLYGYYTYTFVRTPAGWKISKYAMAVTGQEGDPRVFAWTGML